MTKIGRRVAGRKHRDRQDRNEQIRSRTGVKRQGQPLKTTLLEEWQQSEKPLLRENRLIEKGFIAAPQPVVAENPSVFAGAQGKLSGVQEVNPEHRSVLEKFITLEGEQYRIQGDTVLELKENERLLRMQLETNCEEDPTLNQYFSEWIIRKLKTAAKQATPYRYRQFYNNHMRDSIGRIRIRDLKRRDILLLQTDLLEKVSPGTVNYLLQLLRQILNDAVADEIIAKNPAANIRRLKETGNATDSIHRALTEEEQKLFLGAVRGTDYYTYFAFLLLTGLRQGEASALYWGDIDWENNLIHVHSTLTFSADGHIIIGPPKSKAGERDIPMNESIRRILRMQEKNVAAKWTRRALNPQKLVFPSVSGTVIHNATANKVIDRALAKLADEGVRIDHFSCHALRDSFATRFIEQGGTPQTLKTLLGHTSLKMTMDLYAQVLPNTRQKEMDMVKIDLGDAFTG